MAKSSSWLTILFLISFLSSLSYAAEPSRQTDYFQHSGGSSHSNEEVKVLIDVLEVKGGEAIRSQDPHRMFNVIQIALGGVNISDNAASAEKFRLAHEDLARFRKNDKKKTWQNKAQTAWQNLQVLEHFWNKTTETQRRSLLSSHRLFHGTIRENLAHKMYELPQETVIFVVAVIADRILTCTNWGGSKFPQWETTIQDPACLYEIGEMLVTPTFYAGLGAFLLASGMTNVGLVRGLEALRLKGVKWAKPMQLQSLIGNLAMALGFFADHVTRTILDNEHLHKCAAAVFKQKSHVKIADLKKFELGRDEEGHMNYNFWVHFADTNCTLFRKEITSAQAMGEHLALPLLSMLTSAGILTVGGRAGMGIMRALRIVRVGLSFAGPGGLVMRVGHLVLFFGVNRLVEPGFRKMWFDSFVSPRVHSTKQEILATLEKTKDQKVIDHATSTDIITGQLVPNGLALAEDDDAVVTPALMADEGEPLTSLPIPEVANKKTCSTHYAGFAHKGDLEICSIIPIIPKLASFHDYANAWRSHKILGKYLMYAQRWKTKYDTYFMNYYGAMEHMKIFSRSAEIRFTGQSKAYQDAIAEFRADAEELAAQIAAQTDGDASDIWQRNADKFQEFNNLSPGNESDDLRATEILESLGDEQPIFNHLKAMSDLQYLVDATKEQFLFDGLPQSVVDNFADFKKKVSLLFSHPEFVYYKMEHTTFSGTQTGWNMAKAGVPNQFIINPQDPKFVSWLLDSAQDRYVAIGLMMAQQILLTTHQPNQPHISSPQMLYNFARLPSAPIADQPAAVLRDEILLALKDYAPMFRYENFYLQTYGNYFFRPKVPTERWDESAYGFNTKNLSSYITSQLICGQSATGFGLFGMQIVEGQPAYFTYPTIDENNYCYDHKIWGFSDGSKENDQAAIIERSVFATPWGLYTGVFNAYINRPKEDFKFTDEVSTADWWNSEIKVEAIRYLVDLERDFRQMGDRELGKLTVDHEIAPAILGVKPWPDAQKWYYGGCFAHEMATKMRCHNLFNSALAYELDLYFQILRRLTRNTTSAIGKVTRYRKQVAQCFVDLMNTMTSNNYKETKNKCAQPLIHLKDSLLYEGETRGEIELIKQTPEENLSPSQVRKKVIETVFLFIDELAQEIDTYHQMYNGDYSFKLDEKFEGEIK